MKIEIHEVAIEKLVPYERNSKIHSDEQINNIAAQISQFGFDQPIVVNSDMVIIKGHGRLEAAKKLGLSTVPCIIKELMPTDAALQRIGDNKVAEAPWDQTLLREELKQLEVRNLDLSLTGFSAEEMDAIFTDLDRPLDFSGMNGDSIDEKVQQMTRGVRKSLMIDFAPGDYEFAYLLAKFFRDRGDYIGGMLIQCLGEAKAKIDAVNVE